MITHTSDPSFSVHIRVFCRGCTPGVYSLSISGLLLGRKDVEPASRGQWCYWIRPRMTYGELVIRVYLRRCPVQCGLAHMESSPKTVMDGAASLVEAVSIRLVFPACRCLSMLESDDAVSFLEAVSVQCSPSAFRCRSAVEPQHTHQTAGNPRFIHLLRQQTQRR